MIKGKTTGIGDLSKRMKDLAGTDSVGVQIGSKATSGQVTRVKEGGSVDVSRTAGENITVLRTHAKGSGNLPKRDFTFLSDDERSRCQEIWRKRIRDMLRGGDGDALLDGARAVGEEIIKSFRDHLESGRGSDGAMPPVKESVRKQKERETNKTGLPPLVRTGQLRDMFIHSERKI